MRHDVNPVASWYEATAQRDAYPEALGEITADACVIGGGLAGLTTAHELQRRGLSTVLLEGARIGCAASGRNGGFVSNGFALGIDSVEKRVGLAAAQALYGFSKEGTDFVRQTILANQPELIMGHGWRMALRHPDDGGLKAYVDMLNSQFGEQMTYAAPEETRKYLNSARYFHSLSSATAFHIHPLRYALLLGRLAASAGLRIFERSRAQSVSKEGASFVVRTERARITARHIVHCVSALDTGLHRPSGRAILPVATYVAVTEPLQQDSIRTSSAASDTRRAGDYYRLIDEGRLLWGGRITTRVSEPSRLAERMKGDMLSVYPGLGNPRIDYAWAGLMGYAIHKMPLIGRDADGQWFATGFGGHGLNTTAMAGLLISRAIADGDDSYRRFAPFAPDWAFGQLGRLGVQGSYWWMQLRDRIDEAKAPAS
ncbi:MAG: FAD-binding oxidoreductase [Proteobacteria bacterium]|nr:FAD-binding oxidoreductase [Pseudomonadota bacterium]